MASFQLQELTPQLALKNPCLFDAVASFSALQLYRSDPLETRWKDLHTEYYFRASQGHRATLNDLESADCDATFLTTAFIYYNAFQLLGEYSDGDAFERISQMLRLSEANQLIVHHFGNERFFQGRLRTLFVGTPDISDGEEWVNENNKEAFGDRSLWRNYDAADLDHQSTYEVALSFFGLLQKRLAEGEDVRVLARRITSIPARIPDGFALLVQQQDQRALAMMCLMFCQMAMIEHEVTFFHGIAQRQIPALKRLLQADWHWAVREVVENLKSVGHIKKDHALGLLKSPQI